MGGVPKQRKTKSRQGNRRMHLFIKKVVLAACSKCGKKVLPHTMCRNCGYYKGKEVVDVMKKLTKKEQKQRKKEMEAKKNPETKEGLPSETSAKEGMSWEELSK